MNCTESSKHITAQNIAWRTGLPGQKHTNPHSGALNWRQRTKPRAIRSSCWTGSCWMGL